MNWTFFFRHYSKALADGTWSRHHVPPPELKWMHPEVCMIGPDGNRCRGFHGDAAARRLPETSRCFSSPSHNITTTTINIKLHYSLLIVRKVIFNQTPEYLSNQFQYSWNRHEPHTRSSSRSPDINPKNQPPQTVLLMWKWWNVRPHHISHRWWCHLNTIKATPPASHELLDMLHPFCNHLIFICINYCTI